MKINIHRTKCLDQWCLGVEKIAAARIECLPSDLLTDTMAFHFWEVNRPFKSVDLSEKEREICKAFLFKLFSEFNNQIKNCHGWHSVLDQLRMISIFIEEYNHVNIRISNSIKCEAKKLLYQIELYNYECLKGILYDSCEWSMDDITMLSNKEIINRTIGNISPKTRLQKIRSLITLRDKINETDSAAFFLNIPFNEIHPKVENRDLYELRESIKNLIHIHTPSIEFNSKGQIEILKKIVKEIAHNTEWPPIEHEGQSYCRLSETFDYLIATKSYVSSKQGASKDSGWPMKRDAKPSDTIRQVMSVVQSFNKRYASEDMIDLQLWINYLFLDVSGFSLAHILKAPQRSSKVN